MRSRSPHFLEVVAGILLVSIFLTCSAKIAFAEGSAGSGGAGSETPNRHVPGEATSPAQAKEKKPSPYQWRDLFDGKTLNGWKVPKFGGEGQVKVEDGCIVMERGDPMTGIAWAGDFPKTNYEVEYVAKRTDGIDFFATVTFPVGDSFCSFVTGGWGGSVIGLS
jgi:hypothetical protein